MISQDLKPTPRSRIVATAIFVVIALILVIAGCLYYTSEKEAITREQQKTLAAIGELKTKQIQQWRYERKAEAERAAKDSLTIDAVSNLLADPGNQTFKKELRKCLEEEVTDPDLSETLVFDTRENLLASTSDANGPLTEATRQVLRDALAGNKPVFSNFYRIPGDVIHIDLATPVLDRAGRPLAMLVLRHEAGSYLYPHIQTWPTPSRSAESYLVQRDGSEALILNTVRHRRGTALDLRIPLTETDVSSVQAALGQQGIFEGRDYRGVKVLSDIHAIPGSPWFLVSEVDQEEIFSEARYRAIMISVIVGLLLLLAAGLIVFFYRHRQVGLLKHLIRSERQKGEAQEKAWEIGERHKTILHAAMDGFWLVDTKGDILEVNDAYCRMTGFSEQELLTMNVSDLDALESKEEAAAHVQKIITQGHDFFESRQRCKDGSLIDVEASVQFRSSEGIMAAFIRDISGRKRAEEKLIRSERFLRESQQTARIGYYALNLETGLWESSPILDELFGIDQDFVRDTDGWGSLVHPDEREKSVAYLLRIVANKEPFRLDYRILRHNDGALRWMAGYGEFEYDASGNPLHLIGCIQDITELKAAEEELRKANEELKHNIQRAEDLAGKAEAATRAKSEFLAVMSHELRTPLNGVLGFAELLSETPLNQEQLDYARTIRDSGDHLLGIVNDILDFSSIEKGTLSIDSARVSVPGLIESASHALRKTAVGKGLEFRCEPSPLVPEQITGDSRRIRQILINLVGNAVKFTGKGTVVFRIAPALIEGRAFLTFSVEDTGPGISPEMLGRLFKPFTQADSTLQREFGGAGLGLAISQRLAEAMGGVITVESTPGKGSTFTFQLPQVSQMPAASVPVPLAIPPALPAGGLVLVVEDDRVNSMLAGKMLNRLGFRVEHANNGLEAIEAFVPGKYFAILMDMQMPEMDGIEATRKIRTLESGEWVPIIALTANVSPGDREKCLDAGMSEFLSKPFKKDELATKLAGAKQP
ncbi:MAG: PAS domain S-box protein [Terrimicrobiaceae bacterium]